MTLLNVERIKLFSTRSPYWCLAMVLAIGAGITLIIALSTSNKNSLDTADTQIWANFGLMVIMVMAALSVTTEYRFGTIRNSFLAVPKRVNVLVSKTLLVALIAAVVGFVTSLIAYFVMKTVAGDGAEGIVLSSGSDWRIVAGNALTFAIAAVISIAVGTLIRQSAGAITILLLWPLLVESLFNVFGSFGRDLAPWLPFAAGSRFTQDNSMEMGGESLILENAPSPLQGILIFAATGVVIWLIALVALNRRDA